MNTAGALVTFVVTWWLIFFMALPFGAAPDPEPLALLALPPASDSSAGASPQPAAPSASTPARATAPYLVLTASS